MSFSYTKTFRKNSGKKIVEKKEKKFRKNITFTKLYINRIIKFFDCENMNSNKSSLQFYSFFFSKYCFHTKVSLISKFSIFRNKCQKTENGTQKMGKLENPNSSFSHIFVTFERTGI